MVLLGFSFGLRAAPGRNPEALEAAAARTGSRIRLATRSSTLDDPRRSPRCTPKSRATARRVWPTMNETAFVDGQRHPRERTAEHDPRLAMPQRLPRSRALRVHLFALAATRAP
jgi:hypothetical protein